MPIDIDARAILDPKWRVPLGYADGMEGLVINGINPDIDTGATPEDIWGVGGTYTGFPSVAQAIRLTSSSANDTSAGTGARTVLVQGLDANYNKIQDVMVMNGTTPVVSLGTYLRVYNIIVTSVGSVGTNVGTITCQHNVTTANVFGSIQPSAGVNQDAVYTVPAGKVAIITRIFGVQDSSNTMILQFRAKINGVDLLLRQFPTTLPANVDSAPSFGFFIPEKTDLYIRAVSLPTLVNNITFSGGFEVVVLYRTV